MQEIKFFLEKFKNILQGDRDLKNELIVKINKETGIILTDTRVKIKEKTAFIQEKPVVKSEIFLKKDKIIESLAGKITDLR